MKKVTFIKGTLEATTFDPKGWAVLPLELGPPTQVVSVTLDGKPAGVSNRNGTPFVELRGAQKFRLEFELRGPLELEAGRARLTAQVVPGGATRLVATVPGNVEVDVKAIARRRLAVQKTPQQIHNASNSRWAPPAAWR